MDTKDYTDEAYALRDKYADDENAVNAINGIIANGHVTEDDIKTLKGILGLYFGYVDTEEN